MTTAPTIPPAIRRAGYIAEREAWQRELAQYHARMEAQRAIGQQLGRENTPQIAQITEAMETIAVGIVAIDALIAGLAPPQAHHNGHQEEHGGDHHADRQEE